MEISKVRQALEVLYYYVKTDNAQKTSIVNEGKNMLDQFITDYENLLKENEELKEAVYKVAKHFIIAGKKDNLSTQEIINILKDADLEIQQEKLQNNQAIEPSVLEKLDELEKENKECHSLIKECGSKIANYQCDLTLWQGKYRTLEKQLDITNKAFDLICEEHTAYIRQKEKLRNYYLKKAKEESEKEQICG